MNYRLDLETLLHMLNQSTGILETDAVRIPGVRGRCHVHLRIVNGTMSNCAITDERGAVLSSQEVAFKRIQHLVLEWRYMETPSPREESPLLREEILRRQPIPVRPIWLRRIRQVNPQEFQTWPRLYRSVFSLTANPITIERIMSVIGSDQRPETIQEVIYVLVQRGFLRVENEPHPNFFT